MTIKMTRVSVLVFACLLLSACGGKKETISEDSIVDITRPPQTVKDAAKPAQEETNPDETISYDEWRRRREQEAQRETP